MTYEEAEKRQAENCGLSLDEYRRRLDELLRQVEVARGRS